ncbi:Biphenyl-2,3-diol 1,2-dioxygenase 2 [Colletotrichum sidae]|uniref:Biphenyl-2,3-diol 1,2-dioxygenase 2 n=1 Tax=Colletotrichum sidae TaxID=1347389 RepID=A0A4R8TJU0_9PEZI|nr:Biphenyl-2,3-diol 1,2-dioxygenase 2 [Colletotrichum sidae]
MAPSMTSSPIEIAHIGLRTRSPERMIDFYQRLVGAKVVLANDSISVLAWDQEHHRLALLHDKTAVPKQENAAGFDHVALKFASVKDLVQVYRAGKEAGIMPKFCLNHGVSTSLYYSDPDGNKIEMLIEAYDNADEVQKHMKNLDPANVKAVRLDPEELLRRVDAGESNESLRKAGFIGSKPLEANI